VPNGTKRVTGKVIFTFTSAQASYDPESFNVDFGNCSGSVAPQPTPTPTTPPAEPGTTGG
jgi:hypothetical protein